MDDYKSEPLAWYQPSSPLLEQYALSKAIDTQAKGAKQFGQALQVLASPFSFIAGAGAGYLADNNQERNMELQDQFTRDGVAYKSDMQGNIVPIDNRGLVDAMFGAGGVNGRGGVTGLLGSLFGGGAPTAPQQYGGYVVDGSGRPINSGSGFLSYGSGPAMNDNSVSRGGFQTGEVGIDQ
jgi:hypothetical protein